MGTTSTRKIQHRNQSFFWTSVAFSREGVDWYFLQGSVNLTVWIKGEVTFGACCACRLCTACLCAHVWFCHVHFPWHVCASSLLSISTATTAQYLRPHKCHSQLFSKWLELELSWCLSVVERCHSVCLWWNDGQTSLPSHKFQTGGAQAENQKCLQTDFLCWIDNFPQHHCGTQKIQENHHKIRCDGDLPEKMKLQGQKQWGSNFLFVFPS